MVTRMTENGVSTCRAAGTEQFEKFQTGFGRRKRTLVQYDYRASDGELFSCVAPTLEDAAAGAMHGYRKRKERRPAMNDGYETLIITFSELIEVLDGRFEDIDTWGVDSLKKWVDDYETTRFTPINGYTAVITSEYNMKPVREWLEHYMPIAEMKEL